jgi:hypothetical protein
MNKTFLYIIAFPLAKSNTRQAKTPPSGGTGLVCGINFSLKTSVRLMKYSHF